MSLASQLPLIDAQMLKAGPEDVLRDIRLALTQHFWNV